LKAVGCDLYVHQQRLDSTTPSGRAMFGMCSVFAEFEREMIRERVNAGLVRTNGTGLGRGSNKDAERWGATKAVIATKVKALHAQGMGKMKIAKTLGIGSGTVQRILAWPLSRERED
jgi:DNA invertase Pin-like site-specific DNA recombinase